MGQRRYVQKNVQVIQILTCWAAQSRAHTHGPPFLFQTWGWWNTLRNTCRRRSVRRLDSGALKRKRQRNLGQARHVGHRLWGSPHVRFTSTLRLPFLSSLQTGLCTGGNPPHQPSLGPEWTKTHMQRVTSDIEAQHKMELCALFYNSKSAYSGTLT